MKYLYRELLSPSPLERKGDHTATPEKVSLHLNLNNVK